LLSNSRLVAASWERNDPIPQTGNQGYSQTILHPPQVLGSTVALGSKDIALFREAAVPAHHRLPLADLIAHPLHLAQEAGMKDVEWSVGQYRIAQSVAAGAGSGEPGNSGFNIG
jgi:hypothetical protein